MLGFPQWVAGHVPSWSVSMAPARGVRLAMLFFLSMVARRYGWQGVGASASPLNNSHPSGWWSSGCCSSAPSSSVSHGGDGKKRVERVGSQRSGSPRLMPFFAEDSRRPLSWRPTLQAIWWPPLPATLAGDIPTSKWRPCMELKTALHFLSAPSGVVPGAGEDGRVSSSVMRGGCGGPDCFFQFLTRVCLLKSRDLVVILFYVEVLAVICNCTAV